MAVTTSPALRDIILQPTEWEYRDEGNQNVVIFLPKEGHVIRIRKEEVGFASQECQDGSPLKSMALATHYADRVMRIQIGPEFVPMGELIRVCGDLAALENLRPHYRRNKKLNTTESYGTRQRDCTKIALPYCDGLDNVAVEIKPKMGFLPTSTKIPDKFGFKKRLCKFQLMQKQKMKNGRIKEISDYCPLQLFSGNEELMKNALKSLIKCPQNNLRIFKNGHKIYGDEELDLKLLEEVFEKMFGDLVDSSVYEDGFCQLVVKALLHNSAGVGYHMRQCCDCESKFVIAKGRNSNATYNQALPKDCVLGRILTAQKLDIVDVEGVLPIYRQVLNQLDSFTEEQKTLLMYGMDDELLKQLEEDLQGKLKMISNFLMAASAKDCSVIVALNKVTDRSVDANMYNFIEENDMRFAFEVAVLDLDIKPHERIEKYCIDERKLVENYVTSN